MLFNSCASGKNIKVLELLSMYFGYIQPITFQNSTKYEYKFISNQKQKIFSDGKYSLLLTTFTWEDVSGQICFKCRMSILHLKGLLKRVSKKDDKVNLKKNRILDLKETNSRIPSSRTRTGFNELNAYAISRLCSILILIFLFWMVYYWQFFLKMQSLFVICKKDILHSAQFPGIFEFTILTCTRFKIDFVDFLNGKTNNLQ